MFFYKQSCSLASTRNNRVLFVFYNNYLQKKMGAWSLEPGAWLSKVALKHHAAPLQTFFILV